MARISLIIPTANIIASFEYLDRFFWFYDGGIKAIVKNCISFNTATDYSGILLEELLQDVLQIYEEVSDLDHRTNSAILAPDWNYLELAITHIDNAVNKTLEPMFHSELKNAYWDTSESEWIGDDLLLALEYY